MLVGVLLLFSWNVPCLTTYNVTDNRMVVVDSWKKKPAGQWFQSWEKNYLILKKEKAGYSNGLHKCDLYEKS